MNKQFLFFLQAILFSMDIILLNLIFILSGIFFDDRIPDQYQKYYFEYFLLINSVWIITSWIFGIYSNKCVVSFEHFFRKTFRVYFIWFVLVIVYLFFTREVKISRLFVSSMILVFGVGLMINRFIYIAIKKYIKKGIYPDQHILIVGYNNTSKKLASYLEKESLNSEILGFTENEQNVTELSNYPIMGDVNSSVEISKQYNVDQIFSTITPEQEPRLYKLMQEAEDECIRFKIVPDLSYFIKGQYHVSYLNDIPILTLRGVPLDNFNNRLRKRMFDIVVSFFVVVLVLTWLVPLISILIFIESGFPILFTQWRTGKNGKKFRCFKFRSMKINKDAEVAQASKDDKRITRIGKILRKTSLDEFPQFWNVLIGNMSIVGPRPHMLKHTEDFSKLLNHQYMVRHFLKPGVTGWAQVNGLRGEITETEQLRKRIEHDIWYVENWYFWLDLKIIFSTIGVIKGSKNAY